MKCMATDKIAGHLRKETFFNPATHTVLAKQQPSIARSFWITYGFPVITTRCSNTGPSAQKETYSRTIHALVNKKKLGYTVRYQIRDCYVEDHIDAISTILNHGHVGDVYNIGGGREISNIRLVKLICGYFDKINGKKRVGILTIRSNLLRTGQVTILDMR